jgi:hypothetical protein
MVGALEPRTVTSAASRAELIGRRVALGVFIALVSAFIVVCSVQIIRQAWEQPKLAEDLTCREHLAQLLGSLRAARKAAEANQGGERLALSAFRAALSPQWNAVDSLHERCARDPVARRLAHELAQLRYAEEHAVRYESRELAARRNRVARLEQELLEQSPSPRRPPQ